MIDKYQASVSRHNGCTIVVHNGWSRRRHEPGKDYCHGRASR